MTSITSSIPLARSPLELVPGLTNASAKPPNAELLLGRPQSSAAPSSSATQELTDAERQVVEQLKRQDAHVRRHEAAHIAAAGAYVRGGPSYEYEKGPDGKLYAVGGEVSIDTSAESDPEATIAKMQVVRAAALAPADPSAQDRAVAAKASATEARARRDLAEEQASDSGPGNATAPHRGKGSGAVAVGQILDLFA